MQVEEIGTVARAAHHRVVVALLRHLDLDHVGAPVGEVARRRRAGAGPRQIDHLEAGQGALAFAAHCDITLVLPSSVFHASGVAEDHAASYPGIAGSNYSSSQTSTRLVPWKWLGDMVQPLIFL